MKYKLASTFFISALICGCSFKKDIYTSIAHEKSQDFSVKTDFKVIKKNQEKEGYPASFGIIAAKDNNIQRYTLIAPSLPIRPVGRRPNSLERYKLNDSVPLSIQNVHELVSRIEQSVKDWNTKYPRFKGKSILFRVKLRTKQLSFYYQNGFDGPIAMLSIHTGRESAYTDMPGDVTHDKTFNFEIKGIIQLSILKELLELSLKEEDF